MQVALESASVGGVVELEPVGPQTAHLFERSEWMAVPWDAGPQAAQQPGDDLVLLRFGYQAGLMAGDAPFEQQRGGICERA